MKKKIILTLTLTFIILTHSDLFSQYYFYNDKYYDKDLLFEIGGSFGSMHGLANVGRKEKSLFLPAMIDWKSTKSNAGFYLGAIYRSVIAGRLELTTGSVAGADINGLNKDRNLSYRSDILEFSAIGELHILELLYKHSSPLISPYVSSGIAVFSFNPQAFYNGGWVNLQPLRTEGQGFKEYPDRKPYSLTSAAVAVGGGFKYEVSSFINVRAEALFRQTLTDYLDDANKTAIDPSLFYDYFPPAKAELAAALSNRATSPEMGIYRGSTKYKDRYLTLNLKVGLALGRPRR